MHQNFKVYFWILSCGKKLELQVFLPFLG